MPKIHVERSIVIGASPARVFAVVSDLAQWKVWSPWLVTEPETEVVVEPGGKSYSWKGKRTGQGEMRITAEQADKSLALDLVFLKPFKSRAQVGFLFRAQGDGTQLSWTMDSSLPFFMFFFAKMMSAMIGMDFERGLRMLKDYVENASVASEITQVGEQEFAGCSYVGIKRSCALAELGERMSEDFKRLTSVFEDQHLSKSGPGFSLYHEWNLLADRVVYTAGFPVVEAPKQAPSDVMTGALPSLRCYVLSHRGSYHHLGNAWATGMQMSRGKEFRASKAHPPFELYVSEPEQLGASDIGGTVQLHFPLR